MQRSILTLLCIAAFWLACIVPAQAQYCECYIRRASFPWSLIPDCVSNIAAQGWTPGQQVTEDPAERRAWDPKGEEQASNIKGKASAPKVAPVKPKQAPKVVKPRIKRVNETLSDKILRVST